MDIRTHPALQGYAQTKALGSSQSPAKSAVQSFEAQLKQTDQIAQQAMIGQADSQALVEALAQTELAVETAATVRDRVVEAYQEILRMPV